jgi:hypothetical protein
MTNNRDAAPRDRLGCHVAFGTAKHRLYRLPSPVRIDGMEHWLPVPDYEGLYEVSDMGRIRSQERIVAQVDRCGRPYQRRVAVRILRTTPNTQTGYPRVNSHRNGKGRTIAVHQLVLSAFRGRCPPGREACHANDIRADNRLSNLRWDTPSANNFDCVRNGNHRGAGKTRCSHGHLYDNENTDWRTNRSGLVQRVCRACARDRNARWMRRHRAPSTLWHKKTVPSAQRCRPITALQCCRRFSDAVR